METHLQTSVIITILLLMVALLIWLYKTEQKRQRNLLEDKMIHLLDSFIEFLKDSTQESFDYYSQKNGRLVKLKITLKDFKDMCNRAQESSKDIGIEISADYNFHIRFIDECRISLCVYSHKNKTTGNYDLWYGRILSFDFKSKN